MTDEQRMHKRFKAPAGTIMYTADSMRQIVDIGPGGFSLKCLDKEPLSQEQKTVDILLGGILLKEVPVTVSWDEQAGSSEKGSAEMHHVVGVKFENLTEQQRAMIDNFISQHITAGNA